MGASSAKARELKIPETEEEAAGCSHPEQCRSRKCHVPAPQVPVGLQELWDVDELRGSLFLRDTWGPPGPVPRAAVLGDALGIPPSFLLCTEQALTKQSHRLLMQPARKSGIKASSMFGCSVNKPSPNIFPHFSFDYSARADGTGHWAGWKSRTCRSCVFRLIFQRSRSGLDLGQWPCFPHSSVINSLHLCR